MALAGITAVGEFHYLHHGPGGAPYADPNEMGEAVIDAARRGRHPHHAARRLLPARRHRRAARRGAAALRRRRRRRLGRARRRRSPTAPARGSAPRSTASARVDPRRGRASSPHGRPSASWPLHAHVSEQPAENEACLAAYGRTPDRRARRAPARSASGSRPSTPRTSTTATSRCSAARAAAAASARRPSATSPTASARRGRCAEAGAALALGTDSHAVIDLLRGGARRSSSTSGSPAASAARHRRRRRCSRAATADGHATHRLARGGPDRGRARSPTSSTIGLDGVRLAGHAAEHALESVVFAATRGRRARRHRRRAASRARRRATSSIDVAAELRDGDRGGAA